MFRFNEDYLPFDESDQRNERDHLVIKVNRIVNVLSEEDLFFLLELLNQTTRSEDLYI